MKPASTPFKFLDAYQEQDSEVFFGREEETEALYEALSGVKHLLVYGPSGAGKTSLIECGLRNQFSDADWFAITIRRGNNINHSVYQAINQALDDPFEMDPETGLPADPEIDFGQATERLFNERFQPVYLLFDQFEELLLLGSQEEKENFFKALDRLIRYRLACRILLVMREEFVGHLSEFESFCPSLFRHRFRLEKMGRSSVRKVIYQMLEAPFYEDFFDVEDSDQLADLILSKLPDQKKEIELTHVQVFLSELWDRAVQASPSSPLPLLTTGLVEEEDNLEGVLDAFLKKQLKEVSAEYGEQVPLEVLAIMISEKHTKLQVSLEEIVTELDNDHIVYPQPLDPLIRDLEQRRIIRTIRAGEENRYEISHDLLAYVVGQNLTEEIQLREKAEAIYRVFADRSGYFSPEELDYLRPYQQYKPYPAPLEQRVRQSEAFHQAQQQRELEETKAQARKELALVEEKLAAEKAAREQKQRSLRKQRRYLIMLGVVFIISVLAGVVAFQQRDKAEGALIRLREEQLAKQKSDSIRINALEKANQANFLRFFNEGKSFARMGEYPAAIEQFGIALSFDSSRADTITLLIAQAERDMGVSGLFEEDMRNGDIALRAKKLSEAMDYFESAEKRPVAPSTKQRASNKINETRVEMLTAFKALVQNAQTFLAADSCSYALFSLKEATSYQSYLSGSNIQEEQKVIENIRSECPED